MKVMFMDESGDHSLDVIDSQYPVFCLAGVIIDENNYQQVVNPALDKIKTDFFNDTGVVFHSHSIRKCIEEFLILLNPQTRKDFYQAMNDFMTISDVTVLASVILKEKLKDKYTHPSNPYAVSMMFLMERFLYYLEETDDQGYITVESRDPKSNSDLFDVYSHIMDNGSGYLYPISSARFKSRITKIEFVTKKQNENGHQIADLIAYPISTRVLHPTKPNPAYDIIRPKIRQKRGQIIGCGLKIFP